MSSLASIGVVIVNYRTPDLAVAALSSLDEERQARSLSAILVDGGSADGSAEKLATALADPRFARWARLLALPINGGFGWANNQAMLAMLQSEDPPQYIYLLNPDAVVEPGAVVALAHVLDTHPECGAVGSRLVEADGSAAGAAFRFHSMGRELLRGAQTGAIGRLLNIRPTAIADAPPGEVDWVTGASVMFRAEALRQAGLFDTGFFLYFEEVELMWRLRRNGWTVRHEPASLVRHVGGAATGVTGVKPGATRPPLPAYLYQSRRRMLALTRGRAGAVAASLAWLVGHGLLMARKALGGARRQGVAEEEARGLLRHGLFPSAADLTPAVARWDDPPGRPPAWMARED